MFKATFAQCPLEQGSRLASYDFSCNMVKYQLCLCRWGAQVSDCKFWRTDFHGVQNLCVVSHLCIQFSVEHSLPERYKSFFFPIQLEKHFIKLKGGAYLKYICISLYSFPPSQATAKNSCFSFKLISMKAPCGYFRSFCFQSEYTRPFPSCWNCL